MEQVITITALGDNYIYLYCFGRNEAFVVDPGDAKVVLDALDKHGLKLTHALATHHHFDHIGGINQIKIKTGCDVIAANKAGTLHIGNIDIGVISTPGHTQDSVCYYVQPPKTNNGILFTGDTLFIGGCGRLIESDASSMWRSLKKIADLPDNTLVYPGHDYTEENYKFALTIEPGNNLVKEALQAIKNCQKSDVTTVPSNIGQERATNVFLRADRPEMREALSMSNATTVEVFAELRRRKDVFG